MGGTVKRNEVELGRDVPDHGQTSFDRATPKQTGYYLHDMPAFEYTARDADGRECSGVMQADNESAVVRTLSERAMFPVRISGETASSERTGRGRGVKFRALATVYNQLSDLLNAGVPMLRSLEIISRSTANDRLARIIDDVREHVSGGETLADAMGRHPKIFSNLHVAMVRAGEHAGFLEEVLTNLGGFIERQDELRSKVRGAMIYPVVLASFTVVIVSVLLIVLVPIFQQFLSGADLPLPSRMLFATSGAMRNHWLVILGAGVLAVLLLRAWIRSDGGRKLWANWQLKIPLAGRAIRMVAITRFCRVLGTMLHNGVPIIQAMTISKDAVGNDMIADAVEAAAENVRAGEPLAEPLRRSGLFPAEIIEMIAVGEESNQLEKVLLTTADTVERRTNRQVDAAVRLIEPLMLMIMAGAIGFIAMGLLYPIFTMAQSLQ